MSKRESIGRYNLIIQKLRKRPATFEEICSYLETASEIQGYNFTVGKRTFQRDLNDIRTLYNIDIKCNKSSNAYYINTEDEPIGNERLLEAFDIMNALKINDNFNNFIQFENRKPQGTEHLYGLIHAIKNQVQVSFTYQKFWEEELSFRTVEPYALKESKYRWYVLANDLKDNKVKTFALDRISDLEINKKRFKIPSDFKINEYFRHCFGIIGPEKEPLGEIILSFDPIQGKYIKSLPLHETQEILTDNEDELRIRLHLYPTHDFIMELLSYGDYLKVIEPESLISEVKTVIRNMAKIYELNPK